MLNNAPPESSSVNMSQPVHRWAQVKEVLTRVRKKASNTYLLFKFTSFRDSNLARYLDIHISTVSSHCIEGYFSKQSTTLKYIFLGISLMRETSNNVF